MVDVKVPKTCWHNSNSTTYDLLWPTTIWNWHWESTLTPSCRIFFWKQWSLSHSRHISLFLMSQQYCHLLFCTCVEHLISPWRQLTDCRPFTVCEIQGPSTVVFCKSYIFPSQLKAKVKQKGPWGPDMSQPWSGNLLHIYLAVMLKEKLNILHYYSSYLFYSTPPSKIPHVFVLQSKLSWW